VSQPRRCGADARALARAAAPGRDALAARLGEVFYVDEVTPPRHRQGRYFFARTRYPAFLMLSSDHDDRVDPMHARKFTAALQRATASQAPVWLRIEQNAGHGGADVVKQQVDEWADTFAFVQSQFAP
jgi:hypothetical protein